MQLRCIQYLSRALTSARDNHERTQFPEEESKVHNAVQELIVNKFNAPQSLEVYDFAQLTLIIISVSCIHNEGSPKYADWITSILPYVKSKFAQHGKSEKNQIKSGHTI